MPSAPVSPAPRPSRLVLLSAVLGAAHCVALRPLAAAEPVSFRRQIAPLLVEHCLACHGPRKAAGGYRIDTFALAVATGDSEAPGFIAGDPPGSEAFRRIVATDPEERMPLDGDPLPEDQVSVIKRWIEEGARFDGPDPKASLPTILPPPVHPRPPEAYPQPVPIAAVAFSPDGGQLVAGGYHELTVWDPADGRLLRRIGDIGQRTTALSWSPDGKSLAVACGSPGRLGEVRFVNVSTGEVTMVLGAASDVLLDVAYSPRGDRVAVGGTDGVVRAFTVATGEEQLAIPCHSDWVHAVAWDASGGRLASASRDKTAKVIDVETGELVTTFSGHGQPVKGIAFHPDGAEVYSAGADKKIQRWKIADAAKTAEVVFGDEVYRLPTGGGFLFASSADKTVRQFDARTHALVRQYAGATDSPLSIAFHEGTRRLAAGCFNGEVRVWNAGDGASVVTILAAPHLDRGRP